MLKLRNEYSDKIKNDTLTVDICFGSPSYAAGFVRGRSENGLLAWENKDGIKLKDLYTDDNTTVTSGNKKNKFRENVLFTSSSTAGACVTGASVNGNDVWKK